MKQKIFTDLSKVSKIYFVGIKGVAMTGLALMCLDLGKEVMGSDVEENFITQKALDRGNIKVFSGFSKEHLSWNPDLVVFGMSFSDENVEVLFSKQKNIPIILESELRGIFMKNKYGITVSGVHGKTTTTALLAYIFTKADLDPTFLIGTGEVPNLGRNARAGTGEYVIIEGDEYRKSFSDPTPKFLDLPAKVVITTSVEWEHVDLYQDDKEIQESFRKLVKTIPSDGYWVACIDWPLIHELVLEKNISSVETYGMCRQAMPTGRQANWQPSNILSTSEGMQFDVFHLGKYFETFHIKMSGKHNVQNALACIIVAYREGISIEVMKDALKNFSSSARRFEIREHKGILFIDDYGHHPTEIRVTLEAVKERFPGKEIWCVFQPHTATRTFHLKELFAQSFGAADHVALTDIFTSARERADLISSKELLEEMIRYHPDVFYTGGIEETVKYLFPKMKAGDILVTMGAGDVYKVRDMLIS